ncbi:hypothetical protein, partial [Burkholderia puraquae]|uniref:hypothetical protein n=1 Tax=Burkholderia puraquae TaxID=1904757 RepID=UPI001C2EDF54
DDACRIRPSGKGIRLARQLNQAGNLHFRSGLNPVQGQFQHVATHYSRLTAIARFALHVEMRDEDRRYVLQAIRELTELGEEDLRR